MIYEDQAAEITLTIAAGPDLTGASASASILCIAPSGTESTLTSAVLDTDARTITKTVPAETLDEVGTWRFVGYVTIGTDSYPCTVIREYVHEVGTA